MDGRVVEQKTDIGRQMTDINGNSSIMKRLNAKHVCDLTGIHAHDLKMLNRYDVVFGISCVNCASKNTTWKSLYTITFYWCYCEDCDALFIVPLSTWNGKCTNCHGGQITEPRPIETYAVLCYCNDCKKQLLCHDPKTMDKVEEQYNQYLDQMSSRKSYPTYDSSGDIIFDGQCCLYCDGENVEGRQVGMIVKYYCHDCKREFSVADGRSIPRPHQTSGVRTTSRSTPEIHAQSILGLATHSTKPCGKCGGTGHYSGICDACGGQCVVLVPIPATICGWCKGTGFYGGTCGFCHGRGWAGAKRIE